MEAFWAIILAFVLGFAARQVGLPPLVGFLVAGFALHAFGYERGEPMILYGLCLAVGGGLAFELEELGVKAAFDLYGEAGAAYAEHVYQRFAAPLAR